MDYQVLFNISVGVAAFFGGYSLNQITRTLERLDQDVRELPTLYVSRVDYRDDIRELKEITRQIFDKLDAKADKRLND